MFVAIILFLSAAYFAPILFLRDAVPAKGTIVKVVVRYPLDYLTPTFNYTFADAGGKTQKVSQKKHVFHW